MEIFVTLKFPLEYSGVTEISIQQLLSHKRLFPFDKVSVTSTLCRDNATSSSLFEQLLGRKQMG